MPHQASHGAVQALLHTFPLGGAEPSMVLSGSGGGVRRRPQSFRPGGGAERRRLPRARCAGAAGCGGRRRAARTACRRIAGRRCREQRSRHRRGADGRGERGARHPLHQPRLGLCLRRLCGGDRGLRRDAAGERTRRRTLLGRSAGGRPELAAGPASRVVGHHVPRRHRADRQHGHGADALGQARHVGLFGGQHRFLAGSPSPPRLHQHSLVPVGLAPLPVPTPIPDAHPPVLSPWPVPPRVARGAFGSCIARSTARTFSCT